MCNILKFTQNSLVTYSILAYLFKLFTAKFNSVGLLKRAIITK